MQPTRMILEDAPATIAIPAALQHHRIEIIFRPLDEENTPLLGASGWPEGLYAATGGCWQEEPLTRDTQRNYETRQELE